LFKVKATLDNVTKTIEVNRGAILELRELKEKFEAKYGQPSLRLSYKFSDGRLVPLYQEFHLQDAIKDASQNGAKNLSFIATKEGATTYTPSTAPVRPASTVSAPVPSRAPPSSNTGGRRFCEECGTTLTPTAKFCSTCGATMIPPNLPSSPPSSAATNPTIPPPRSAPSSGGSDQSCAGCGNPITSKAARALDKLWHPECFSCARCRKSLLEGTFVASSDKQPYCTNCFDLLFGKKCFKCHQPISGVFLNIEGKEYHKECFICTNCGSQFDSGYFWKDGQPICRKCVNF